MSDAPVAPTPQPVPPSDPSPRSETDSFDHQLMAEIRILADFVSSRGDKSLAAGAAGKLPSKSPSYGDALARYFKIFTASRGSMSNPGSGMLSADDRCFLTEFRDYLADAASPANSSTIAFSSLTSEYEKAGTVQANAKISGGVFDSINEAFPLYAALAVNFRRLMKRISTVAILVTIAVGLLSAYVYWGNLILSHLVEVQAHADKLADDRANEERVLEQQVKVVAPATAPHVRDCVVILPSQDGKPVAPISYFDEDPNGVFPVYTSIRYSQICGQWRDSNTDLMAAAAQLNKFTTVRGLLAKLEQEDSEAATLPNFRKQQQMEAAAIVAMINGYVTPILMGLLGASAFVLRAYLFTLSAKTLHPRDARAYRIRLALGVMAGLAIGFFMSPGAALSEQTKGLDTAVTLTGPALAFLAGYAVEVLFGFLDSMARVAFPTNK